MANYVIHACPERMWYVEDYLLPSLHNQGIKNATVYCDLLHLGNLEGCMKVFGTMKDDDDGVWHLQDDVIICRDFKKLTEKYDSGIVCGFVTPRSANIGYVKPEKMWYSFPCIRIPNQIAREFYHWYYSFAKGYAKYYEWVHMNKCDDNFFYEFMKKNHPDMDVLNLTPNLVDHVDFLIGGSLINKYRNGAQIRAAYFEDLDLVESLAGKLKKEKDT